MFYIKMADLIIGIDNKYQFIKKMCKQYRVYLRRPDFVVKASEEEVLKEQAGNTEYSLEYCESLCIYRKICNELLKYDGFLMHSAVVAVGEEAYAFAARSGTGKTTHIKLWRKLLKDKVCVVNGDKPLFRFRGDILYAYGTPWSGKEQYQNNIRRKLKAVCFLERGKENYIEKINEDEASSRIFHQLLLPENEEDAELFFSLIEKMMMCVDFYLMHCNMDIKAAKVAYEEMRK